MNNKILDSAVQLYIRDNQHADVHQIAMGKSPFPGITGPELANQIAARRKCVKKLPAWYHTAGIYYPPLLSIEQCSSEITAAYKAKLADGDKLIDITGGYGVDSYYFSKTNHTVIHCEISAELSAIACHNAALLGQNNSRFITGDGIKILGGSAETYDTIFIDPARRSSSGKVFMLKDCTPDVTANLDLLLSKAKRILIKTAPLLDLSAGLKELKHVAEIHIVSVRNECKELIWIVEQGFAGKPKIVSTALNMQEKHFSFTKDEEEVKTAGPLSFTDPKPGQYLYEPDVALLKSGAFNLIAERYHLQKLDYQTQLYVSDHINTSFPGRIFKIDEVLSAGALKKEKNLSSSVIVRNYPVQAAALVKKFHITPHDTFFMIFTQSYKAGKIVIKATIIQHY